MEIDLARPRDMNALRTSPEARASYAQLRRERATTQLPHGERLRNVSLDKLFQRFLKHVVGINDLIAPSYSPCDELVKVAVKAIPSELAGSKLYELGLKLQSALTNEFDKYEVEWDDVVRFADNAVVRDILKDVPEEYQQTMIAITRLFLEVSGFLDVRHYWEMTCARDSLGQQPLTQLMLTVGTMEMIVDILEGNDFGTPELFVPGYLDLEPRARETIRPFAEGLSSEQKRIAALAVHGFICRVHDQIATNQPLMVVTLAALLPLQTEVAKIQIGRDHGLVAAARVTAYLMVQGRLHDQRQSYGHVPGLSHDLWRAFGDQVVPEIARRI